MRPLSVIIPTFNGEQRLPGLLESIRAQRVDQSSVRSVAVFLHPMFRQPVRALKGG